MTLILTHRAGHCRTSERFCRPDPGPGRNDIQAEGSGESYGRRYLTLAVWNIVTVGADDDGDTADPITAEQEMKLREMLDAAAFVPARLAKFWEFVGGDAGTDRKLSLIQQRDFARVNEALRKAVK